MTQHTFRAAVIPKKGTAMRTVRWSLPVLVAALAPLAFVAPASAAEHDPVIFVHGWNGSGWNWNEMVADFEAAGYTGEELIAWDYDHMQSNKITAEELSKVVDETLAATGADKVDIVNHSMGGLNTRWYLKFLNGTGKVDDWASLAGANHGTTSANSCFDDSCVEMRPGSEFVNQLNEGDESPGATNYGTWWSDCDGTINPPESTVVDGATNTKTGCITHLGMLTDDGVSQQVRDFVA